MRKTTDTRSRRRQRGQGMTEYIIIVALVAIGAIAVVTIFGNNLRALFGSSANALSGTSTSADDLGSTDVSEAETVKGMETFHEFEAP